MVMMKRGQGLSITTLILIIIGVVILVVLIFGFTAGWGNIKEWIAPSGNADKVVTTCRVACASNDKFAWCEEDLVLERSGEADTDGQSCDEWADGNLVDIGVVDCQAILCGAVAPSEGQENLEESKGLP